MIPEGNTIEDIRARETIIRDFYREWKIKNPSQRKYNLSLKGMKKKASFDAFVFCPRMRVGGLRSLSVTLCGRGLRTTHIHRPHTT